MSTAETTPARTTTGTTEGSAAPAQASTMQDWSRVLAEFERSMRTGDDFVMPPIDGPDGLGPMPSQLREHAERLLAECATRVAAVQAEMTEVDRELGSLRSRSTPRGSWTDDGQGSAPAVGHLI